MQLFLFFFPGICHKQPTPALPAAPHATLPYERTGDVAVGEQTQRLKKKKKKKLSQSGETVEQTQERLHPDTTATASLPEKPEEGAML